MYKQLNAPYGSFGLDTLAASTKAIKSTDELVYDSIETKIANLTFQRDALAGTIRSALNDSSFGGGKIDASKARGWIREAQSLIDQAHALATVRSRFTSEGLSSRHWPGSSPSSVSPA